MDMYPVAVPLNAHASIVQVHLYVHVHAYKWKQKSIYTYMHKHVRTVHVHVGRAYFGKLQNLTFLSSSTACGPGCF